MAGAFPGDQENGSDGLAGLLPHPEGTGTTLQRKDMQQVVGPGFFSLFSIFSYIIRICTYTTMALARVGGHVLLCHASLCPTCHYFQQWENSAFCLGLLWAAGPLEYECYIFPPSFSFLPSL